MRHADAMLRVYEELADRFVTENEPRHRDHCLVLAADAALSAGQPGDAERLRQRLLQVNPHHLLRPFASMAEAVQAADVQEYVADLRRQWPADFAQRLYTSGSTPASAVQPSHAPQVPAPIPLAANPAAAKAIEPTVVPPAPPPRKPPVVPVPKARPATAVPPTRGPRQAAVQADAPDSPVGVWLATMLLFLAVAGGLALLFLTFVWPLLQ
jgi:hypothetical protein